MMMTSLWSVVVVNKPLPAAAAGLLLKSALLAATSSQ